MQKAYKNVLFILAIVFSTNCKAQYTLSGVATTLTIPVISMMDIEPSSGSIGLTFTQPTEAGMPIVSSATTNNSKWLNYTSCNTSSVSRIISVSIASGTIPSGTKLELTASTYTGNGKGGTFGTPNSTIQLTNSNQTILSGISSCFTGDGAYNGHNLSYNWQIINYGQLKTISASTLILNFTMVDN